MVEDWALLGVVFTLLSIATGAGQWLKRQTSLRLDERSVTTFNSRVQAWWFFSLVLGFAFFQPKLTVILFGLLAFWALREFITLTPTSTGDHRALFWVFFLFTPMQFVLVAFDYYDFYSILIPVYAFLFIAARVAVSGDFKHFLERVAKIQFGLLVCVYCLSFAPALLYIKCQNMEGNFANARLLFFFVTIVLCFSELLQFLCNRLFIGPSISLQRRSIRIGRGKDCSAVQERRRSSGWHCTGRLPISRIGGKQERCR